MLEKSLLSGAKAGLTAGFAPDASNMFGKIAGRENPGKYFNPFDEFGVDSAIDASVWANKGGMIKQNPQSLLGYLAR